MSQQEKVILGEEKINSSSSLKSMIHLDLAGRVLLWNENHGII